MVHTRFRSEGCEQVWGQAEPQMLYLLFSGQTTSVDFPNSLCYHYLRNYQFLLLNNNFLFLFLFLFSFSFSFSFSFPFSFFFFFFLLLLLLLLLLLICDHCYYHCHSQYHYYFYYYNFCWYYFLEIWKIWLKLFWCYKLDTQTFLVCLIIIRFMRSSLCRCLNAV